MQLYYLISVTDRDRGEKMAALYESCGLHMILTTLGMGTATHEQLSVLGLESTEKSIVSAVANDEELNKAFTAAKRRLFIDIPGNGVMLAVPIKSVAGGRTLSYLTGGSLKGGKPQMNFENELIIVILNEGYSDTVMDAARAAGAGGGTVLHAKGTGSSRGEQFFSVRLADEKDMVYIISHKDEKTAIMQAISQQAGPQTKAGAICFSLPVSAVAGLREREIKYKQEN